MCAAEDGSNENWVARGAGPGRLGQRRRPAPSAPTPSAPAPAGTTCETTVPEQRVSSELPSLVPRAPESQGKPAPTSEGHCQMQADSVVVGAAGHAHFPHSCARRLPGLRREALDRARGGTKSGAGSGKGRAATAAPCCKATALAGSGRAGRRSHPGRAPPLDLAARGRRHRQKARTALAVSDEFCACCRQHFLSGPRTSSTWMQPEYPMITTICATMNSGKIFDFT